MKLAFQPFSITVQLAFIFLAITSSCQQLNARFCQIKRNRSLFQMSFAVLEV